MHATEAKGKEIFIMSSQIKKPIIKVKVPSLPFGMPQIRRLQKLNQRERIEASKPKKPVQIQSGR